jgi:hypothetical protein
MAATKILPAAANEIESCEFHLKGLAKAMKDIHGGDWRTDLNHKLKTAVVFKA